MEKLKKKLVIEILNKQFENNSNFKTDYNLKDENLIKDVQNYLKDFIENDVRFFEINIYFVQGKQYQSITLKEAGQTKFTFNLSLEETLQLLK